jgi:hypothetical protein
MTGIGKIVSGNKKQISAKAQASSRAPWISGQLESSKLGQTMGDVYSTLAIGGSLASSYMKSAEPYKQMQAGGKEVGLDIPDLSIKDRIGMMFGKGADDMLTKNYEAEGSENYQYKEGDDLSVKQTHQYSGATLMDIGSRAESGTLSSFLEGESVGEKFGKDISENKWWDAKTEQMDAHQSSPQSSSESDTQRTFQRGIGEGGGQGAYGNRDFVGGTDNKGIGGGGNLDPKLGRKGMNIGPDKFELQREYEKENPYHAGTHPASESNEPIYTNMQEADYGGEPTNIGGAADTSDLTDYASYDSGYRTSNAHASGYAGMGYDPNEGGQTSMEGAGAQGDPGSNGQPTDMSGDTLYGRENKRFTHTESPGYAGKAARTGQFYSEQEFSEREAAKRDPLAGYEPGYEQSWLKPGSMFSTIGDSLR